MANSNKNTVEFREVVLSRFTAQFAKGDFAGISQEEVLAFLLCLTHNKEELLNPWFVTERA